MTTNNKNVLISVLLVLVLAIGVFYFNKKSTAVVTENDAATSTMPSTMNEPKAGSPAQQAPGGKPSTVLTSGNIAGFYSYANAVHNFSIQYPSYATPLTSFATFHEIGNNWRLYPGQANQGKSVVSFSIHNIDQGPYSTGKQTYPLYFTAEVRVGVSTNIRDCYLPDTAYPGQKITNVTINGIPFKRFSTADTGMMKYTQAESYRTIHNKSCYVIEQIKSGTTYRDDKMTIGTTDAQLENYYNLGEKIVKTFKFTK